MRSIWSIQCVASIYIQKKRTTIRAVFLFLLSCLDILPAELCSPPLPVFLEKLRVRVTRLQRVTRRWPDTGKDIPGHWSQRRLSDVLSFVGVCHWCFILPAIEPPKGLLSLSSVSSFAVHYLTLRSGGGLAISPSLHPCLSSYHPVSVSSSLISRLQSYPSSPLQ